MGYPPPTRRLGDKKRYHYSNNPNRRHPSGVYSKNGFLKSINNGFVPSPTAEISTDPSIVPTSAPPPLPSAMPASTFGIEAPRPSRYDPGSVSRPTSSSYLPARKIGSRYNPEVERPSSTAGSTPENTNSNITSNANADTGKSRYSQKTMSRYNPQSNSSSNLTHFSSSVSNAPPFYVANGNSRVRPRSIDDYSLDVSNNPEPNAASSVDGNSAHSYYSRSNKWRSVGTPSRPPFEDHVGNMATVNSNNLVHLREPFWKSNDLSFLKSSHSQSSPSLYANKFHEVSKVDRSQSPVKIEASCADEAKVTPYHDDKFQLEEPDIKPHVSTESDTSKDHGEKIEESLLKTRRELLKKHSVLEKRKEYDEVEVDVRKSEESNTDRKQDEIWTTATTTVVSAIEEDKEQGKEKRKSIEKKETPEIRNYERIYDPKVLRTDLTKLVVANDNKGYEEPLEEIERCIFPLSKSETRLWELKNQTRNKIVSKQKYLLKDTIKSFTEYPFYVQNKLIHQQATGLILTKIVSKIKKQEYLKRIKLKHDYFDLQTKYEKECEVLTKLSENLRKEEIENKRKEHELMEQKRREKGIETEKEKSIRHSSSSSSSRRRNRADFVDDAEMENVLLQIDPNYKHYQAAATIPQLILDPLKKYSHKFCDVNNLVTDKYLWASRVLKDAVDNFSDHEHSLFLEGYSIHPKKFGKISHYMGGLRTPEECVLHYYRTKKTVNYKQLLIDKNKKRKMSAAAKRRRRKERSNDEEIEIDEGKEDTMDTADKKGKSENIVEEIIHPVLVHVPELEDNPQGISENAIGIAEKESDEVVGRPEDTTTANELKRVYDVIEGNDNKSNIIKVNNELASTAVKEGVQNDYYPEESRELDFGLENALQRKKHKAALEHKTSYWSVRESQLFPELLKDFGSQWSLISEKLGTKSTTMVRNYYQRNAARNGWKLLVDETDLKRDGTSSESVQQSQILIQPERPNINVYNNIPPQQRPALGYFVGQPTQVPNTSMSSIDGSIRPFGPDFHRDSFSKVSTPLTTLPPPRLPSIQFPRSEMPEPTMADLRIRTVDHIDTLADAASSVTKTNNQNFSDERHNIDINRKSATISSLLNNSDRDTKASLQNGPRYHAQIEDTPKLNNIVVQEIKPNITTPRSSSISALLNPVNGNGQSNPDGRPLLPLNSTASQGPSSFPLPPPRTSTAGRLPPKFNFSNDPLAALAAVASAPDAINGFLSKKENNN